RELLKLLNDPKIRHVTILGTGGMGKTRLSLQVAEQLLPEFTSGVYFVSLSSLTLVENIVPAVADAVGYVFSSDPRDHKTQLLDYLREKHLLLVMDNYEHLMDGAALVADMLKAAPNIKVLTTSRERLNLSGETLFNLEGMDFPAWETPADALEYSAVKLFLQGARRARPDFELDAESLPYVARICRLVQGMPLGIVLAAAWVEMLKLPEIAEEIGKSLDFLESDVRDVPDRHRSLRAVFDYSWALMTEDERQVFMKLSIFRGGFTRQGAQAVTDASLRHLTTLVNKSLLRRDPNSARYSIHSLLREYAAERFQQQCDSGAIHERLLAHYAGLLHEYEPIFNTRKENTVLEAMDDELENVRLAMRYGMENRRWAQIDQMQRSILFYFIARSILVEGVQIFAKFADKLSEDGQGDTLAYWRARLHQGWLASRTGDYALVLKLTDAAYQYFQTHNEWLEASFAVTSLSYAQMNLGEYDSAENYAGLGVEYAKRVGNKIAEIYAMANLGYALFLHGNYAEARQIYESMNSPDLDYAAAGRAYGVNNLGEIMQATGDFEGAHRQFAEAYAMFKSANQRRGMGFTLNNLGGVLTMQGKFDEAKVIYEQAYRINHEIGDRAGLGHSLSALGNVAFYVGDIDEAVRRYTESLMLRRQMGDRRSMADSLLDLGDAALAQEDADGAMQLYSESLAIRRQIGDLYGEVRALVWLGMAQHMSGKVPADEIYALYRYAFELSERLENPFALATVHIAMGEVEIQRGDFAAGWDHYQQAMLGAKQFQLRPLKLVTLIGMAVLLQAHGDGVRALEIAALVKSQPRTMVFFMTDAEIHTIITQQRDQLAPDVFEAALARGVTLDVDTLVDGLTTMVCPFTVVA
ncbi:MAG: tetratricopeptide repeat protein, partial [Armatimonadetes bacterium]|nr:tetratricopeptide repeat protein [Anaerolineae bacterium]